MDKNKNPQETSQPDQPKKLDDYWPYKAAVLADHIARHTARTVARHSDLNLSQWRVLAAVGEAPGRLAKEVVAMTPMDKGIVSRAVAALEVKALIRKEQARDDRRRTHLYPTKDGAALYVNISLDLQNQVAGNVANVVEAELVELLDSLVDAYATLASDP